MDLNKGFCTLGCCDVKVIAPTAKLNFLVLSTGLHVVKLKYSPRILGPGLWFRGGADAPSASLQLHDTTD